MKNTFKVFKFEFMSTFKKKSFIISALVLLLGTIVLSSIPKLIEMSGFFNETEDETAIVTDEAGEDISFEYGIFYADKDIDKSIISNISNQEHYDMQMKEYKSLSDIETGIENGEIYKGIIVNSPTDIEVIMESIGMQDSFENVRDMFKEYNTRLNFKTLGLDYEMISKASNVDVELSNRAIGVDGSNSFFMVYIMIFILYMLILIFGQGVATSVAKEKSDRTMEILITSTSASSLINGKVFASALLGLIQLSMIIIGVGVGIWINADMVEFFAAFINFNLDINVIIIYIVFFAIGYLLYLYLFAALGALVSKVEEVGNAVTPVTILFVLAFLAAMIGLNLPESMIIKIASFIPFSSLMTMFVRYALVTVPMIEVFISLGILTVTTIIMAAISIRIYRLGTLNYGNKMKFFQSLKKTV
ncbi:MAG: ABC transporter permease [Tissierellia bacterium]|nr:ABC transporter permease [Tissierellia bacterium]